PTSLKDPKLENLKQALVDWINKTLKAEHIVIQSLEEDLYDGLVLHHLLARLGNVKLDVEEIALTGSSQLRKLEAVMKELDKMLGVEDGCPIKWDVKLIHNKDLLATIHLLVAMAKAFQPELNLPPNVKIDVVTVEVSLFSPGPGCSILQWMALVTAPLLTPSLLNFRFQAILHFVNQNMASLGLQIQSPAFLSQFADGVILLLLIGQLEGFFIPLVDFHLTPANDAEMVGYIVSQDVAATLKVLYALFRKHKRN
uniref:Calponin-homology (CH) domain-containing protein n=1 Tax=Poecilia mexicana TaxID=48701 RepID=A0A3B3XQ12_9TELE